MVVGLTLNTALGQQLKWFPPGGYCPLIPTPGAYCSGPVDWASHLLLPWITFALLFLALYTRMIRASVAETMHADYVRTARAKGVSEWRVIMRHVFRNALIPITTVAALNFGALLGGAIVTETIFSLDGIGFWFIQALNALDLYEVMAYLLVTAIAVVVFNLIADILYGFLDPRIRYD
jgi:peptide/nickel transport system permease protein